MRKPRFIPGDKVVRVRYRDQKPWNNMLIGDRDTVIRVNEGSPDIITLKNFDDGHDARFFERVILSEHEFQLNNAYVKEWIDDKHKVLRCIAMFNGYDKPTNYISVDGRYCYGECCDGFHIVSSDTWWRRATVDEFLKLRGFMKGSSAFDINAIDKQISVIAQNNFNFLP